MKTKLTILIALAAFIFTSCSEKDYYDESQIEKKVGDLDVPVNFDWNMTRTVSCNFTTSSNNFVKVYTENKISDDCLVAEYVLTPDNEALELPVPAYVDKLYLEINNEGKLRPVDINKEEATFVLPATRSNNNEYEWEWGLTINKIYYPSKSTMSTVMFEDFFPVEGDYDFNDFVANYRYTLWLTPVLCQVTKIDVNVKVNALGGKFEYAPYLRIKGAPKCYCTSAEVEEDAKGDIILPIKGYTQKPAGAEYLNTKPSEVKVTNLKEIDFSLIFNFIDGKWITHKDVKFDFFLKGTGFEGGSYEIHERGKEPVNAALYPDHSNLGKVLYTTNKNLVWGFTVPAEIKHAVENANFLSAYPDFRGWVESGGKNNQKWYENGNSTHLFNLN